MATQELPSRRNVLWGAGATAGLAVLAMPALGASGPALAAPSGSSAPSAGGGREAPEPIVAHVRDVRTGDIDLFRGTGHTRLRDRDLAARLARASRKAGA